MRAMSTHTHNITGWMSENASKIIYEYEAHEKRGKIEKMVTALWALLGVGQV